LVTVVAAGPLGVDIRVVLGRGVFVAGVGVIVAGIEVEEAVGGSGVAGGSFSARQPVRSTTKPTKTISRKTKYFRLIMNIPYPK
jgi:hypothetical protein